MLKAYWRKGLLASGLMLLLGLGYLVWTTPSLDFGPLTYSTEVVDREGRVLRRLTTPDGYWRLPVTIDQVDPRFLDQLLAVEDKRFYQHAGVDPRAVLRAGWQWLSRGHIHSGASTLTMQTVRLMRPQPRTLANKLREMLQAFWLERQLSKREILQRYLSLTPYGGNLQGIGAATQYYFGKMPDHLTASEIALLIALPQSPEVRRPDRHPLKARRTRDEILDRLQTAGRISLETAALAKQQPIPTQRRATPALAAHLAERLALMPDHGQRIQTTLDGTLQDRLETLARKAQQRLDKGSTLAFLVVDNQSREVLAHVGSGDYFSVGQWDMTRAVRSPGSTLKPLIYGLGFELGLMHPETQFLDQPQRSGTYAPSNFDGRYHGQISIRRALQLSLNTTAVAAMRLVGAVRFRQRLAALDVQLELPDKTEAGLPIALGGAGLRLEDLVSLYSALAMAGEFKPLRFLKAAKSEPGRQLLTPTATWYLRNILKNTPVPKGYRRHRPIAYKTGTSYGYRDAWSIGFTPSYTLGVWVGRPDGGYGKGMTGSTQAAPLLFQILDYLPQDSRATPSPPEGVLRVQQSGLPTVMQWLGQGPDRGTGAAPPRIQIPVDGAGFERSSVSTTRGIVLQVQGGVPPYHWLIDGQPFIETHQSQTQWQPRGGGRKEILIIDHQGRSDRVEVWLQP